MVGRLAGQATKYVVVVSPSCAGSHHVIGFLTMHFDQWYQERIRSKSFALEELGKADKVVSTRPFPKGWVTSYYIYPWSQ